MRIWKRNTVVSVIVLFVCVALYLSWSYGRDPLDDSAKVFDPAPTADVGVQSGEDVSVDGDSSSVDLSSADSTNTGYFAQARLTRKNARDNALSILNDAADREDVSQEIRDNATGEISKLAQDALTEATIENLIIAKGFTECVAFISQDGINIAVAEPVGGLNAEDAAKITDIVLNNSALTALDIHIVPVSA